ncbi:MAG: hypothetical protein GWP14_09390 [Actinobacteria bacterium]|nr:hypothetical protein [Actinomycetota bacterium]
MQRIIITAGIVLGLLGTAGLAEEKSSKAEETKTIVVSKEQDTPEATQTTSATEELTATVISVTGSAEVREGPGQPWRAVKAGDKYKEGAEIRTGYRSEVNMEFSDNSKITINRVSHFRVDKFRRIGNKVVTRSHLSYGKVRAGVEKGPAVSDYKITTSMGTLGVNGTRDIYLYVDPGSGVAVVCLTEQGQIGWNLGRGKGTFVHPSGCTNQYGLGEDIRKLQRNVLNLVDPFGSTNTEQNVGDNNNNQGDNSKTASTGGRTVPSSTHDWHYLDN